MHKFKLLQLSVTFFFYFPNMGRVVSYYLSRKLLVVVRKYRVTLP